MYLTADKVGNALKCAQEVLSAPEIYAGNSSLLPISIDALRDFIAAKSGYSVEVRQVSFEGTYIYGRIEKYKNMSAIIDIKASLPDDWKRFVVAKELLHLLIDKEEDMSPYGDETLEKLVRDGHIGIISLSNGSQPPLQSELIAEVAAIELLYPIQNRSDDKEKLTNKDTSYSKLALRYGIPANFVDTAFSKTYLQVISAAFAEMEK